MQLGGRRYLLDRSMRTPEKSFSPRRNDTTSASSMMWSSVTRTSEPGMRCDTAESPPAGGTSAGAGGGRGASSGCSGAAGGCSGGETGTAAGSGGFASSASELSASSPGGGGGGGGGSGGHFPDGFYHSPLSERRERARNRCRDPARQTSRPALPTSLCAAAPARPRPTPCSLSRLPFIGCGAQAGAEP